MSGRLWADCPHLHLWDGSCVDCLEDVTWPGSSTVSWREARTRRALAGVRLRLLVYGRPEGSRSTHERIHAGAQSYVTHGSATVPTTLGITAGESSHGTTHATHAQGAVTVSPPSVQGET